MRLKLWGNHLGHNLLPNLGASRVLFWKPDMFVFVFCKPLSSRRWREHLQRNVCAAFWHSVVFSLFLWRVPLLSVPFSKFHLTKQLFLCLELCLHEFHLGKLLCCDYL